MATKPLALAALLVPALAAHAGSWLLGDGPVDRPDTPRASLLGLLEESPELVPYQHPFAVSSWELLASRRAHQAEPGTTYLLRTLPQDSGGATGMAYVRNHLQSARDLGFESFGPLPSPRRARVPLLTMARFEGEAPRPLPDNLAVAPIETGRVHLCLIGLGERVDGQDSHEAPLYVSAPLPPEQAIRRAAAVSRYASGTWGAEGQPRIAASQVREMWPEAWANLEAAGHAPQDIILALRVLWSDGQVEIPGPGGHLLKAVHLGHANRRLHALYASRSELSP